MENNERTVNDMNTIENFIDSTLDVKVKASIPLSVFKRKRGKKKKKRGLKGLIDNLKKKLT